MHWHWHWPLATDVCGIIQRGHNSKGWLDKQNKGHHPPTYCASHSTARYLHFLYPFHFIQFRNRLNSFLVFWGQWKQVAFSYHHPLSWYGRLVSKQLLEHIPRSRSNLLIHLESCFRNYKSDIRSLLAMFHQPLRKISDSLTVKCSPSLASR